VNHQVAEARAKGVTGVPFTIIDGKWAVSGGQSAPVFVKVRTIRKTAIHSARLTTLTDIQQVGRSTKLPTVTVEYTCAHSCCCSSVMAVCPDFTSLVFIPHFIVYWSRGYPQFPFHVTGILFPIASPPCHYQSFVLFFYLFFL
jgi:hypothetical protein